MLDLLDNIFVITAEKRITLEQIKQHPWFTKPMPAKYEAAEKSIRDRQAVLDSNLKDREISPVRAVLHFCCSLYLLHIVPAA